MQVVQQMEAHMCMERPDNPRSIHLMFKLKILIRIKLINYDSLQNTTTYTKHSILNLHFHSHKKENLALKYKITKKKNAYLRYTFYSTVALLEIHDCILLFCFNKYHC